MKAPALAILWPSFLLAGVLEVLVFGLGDPYEMRWFGARIGWSPVAIYSVFFLVFWCAVAMAGALTHLLSLSADVVNDPRAP